MMPSVSALDGLKLRRPEWAAWLSVIEEVLRETGARRWDAAVPLPNEARSAAAPLLSGVTIPVHAASIRRLLKQVIRVAAAGGAPAMQTLEAARGRDLDVLALFKASLCHESDRIKEVAARYDADAEALEAVMALVPVPFLQACNDRWAPSISKSWVEGYCPVCGCWPAFAEVRGIERSRFFRCRCGAAWHAQALACPYCAMLDHHQLVALVPETDEAHAVIDACNRCMGYVKTFTTLQGCPARHVMLEDLASVDLDLAALAQGYARPPDTGYPLDLTVTENRSRRFFAWNA